ncbi:hypothetical protein HK104_003037 [Borealophlyctis nickersoniae]|nr:hypothetical protein HK104_003037 [Borealophlyctis nickersoniae]
MYTIADMIKNLPDDKMISLEHQLLHHIAEFKDGDLAFDYRCKQLYRDQKLTVMGRTEHGKELALQHCALPAPCDDEIQKVFRSVREANEKASRELQEMVELQSSDSDSDSDSDSEILLHDSPPEPVDKIKKTRNTKTYKTPRFVEETPEPETPAKPAPVIKPAVAKPATPAKPSQVAKPATPAKPSQVAEPTKTPQVTKPAAPAKPAPVVNPAAPAMPAIPTPVVKPAAPSPVAAPDPTPEQEPAPEKSRETKKILLAHKEGKMEWNKSTNGRHLYKIQEGLRELFKCDPTAMVATIEEWCEVKLNGSLIITNGDARQVFNSCVIVDRTCEKLEKGGIYFHRNCALLMMAIVWFQYLDCGKKLLAEDRAQINKHDNTRFRNIYMLVFGTQEGDKKLPAVHQEVEAAKMTEHEAKIKMVESLIAARIRLESSVPFDLFNWGKFSEEGEVKGRKRKAQTKESQSQSKKQRND